MCLQVSESVHIAVCTLILAEQSVYYHILCLRLKQKCADKLYMYCGYVLRMNFLSGDIHLYVLGY